MHMCVFNLQDTCTERYVGGGCYINSPLAFWKNNRRVLANDADIGSTLATPAIVDGAGNELLVDDVAGDIVWNSDHSRVLSVGAWTVVYVIVCLWMVWC